MGVGGGAALGMAVVSGWGWMRGLCGERITPPRPTFVATGLGLGTRMAEGAFLITHKSLLTKRHRRNTHTHTRAHTNKVCHTSRTSDTHTPTFSGPLGLETLDVDPTQIFQILAKLGEGYSVP